MWEKMEAGADLACHRNSAEAWINEGILNPGRLEASLTLGNSQNVCSTE